MAQAAFFSKQLFQNCDSYKSARRFGFHDFIRFSDPGKQIGSIDCYFQCFVVGIELGNVGTVFLVSW